MGQAADKMRMAKFEVLIEDINKALSLESSNSDVSTPLDLVFDRHQNGMNDYARVIMEKARIRIMIISVEIGGDPWSDKYGSSHLDDDKERIAAVKDFVEYCKDDLNLYARYKLIFWSLMVLSVDDTDADDKLSLICDFARMLRISDDELTDIVHVIKTVYNEAEDGYAFKTGIVPDLFEEVMALYDEG